MGNPELELSRKLKGFRKVVNRWDTGDMTSEAGLVAVDAEGGGEMLTVCETHVLFSILGDIGVLNALHPADINCSQSWLLLVRP